MKYILKENIIGDESKFYTTVDVEMTATHMVFEFFCKNSQAYSAGDSFNSDLYCGDVCEAFINTSEDINKYYEIEVSPNNNVFLSYVTYNEKDETFVGEFISENFIVSETKVVGKDYHVRFSVPLDKISYNEKQGIRYNAFRIETEGGIRDKNILALNPTLRDTFHYPKAFIKFEK